VTIQSGGSMQIVISLIVGAMVGVSTLYATFATKTEVEKMVQVKHDSVMFTLKEILVKIETVDQRLWDLQKDKL